MLSSALLDQPQCLENLVSKRFYISNKKVPSSTESAMITEITEFTQITGTNDLNLTVMQILMLKIVFICIISGVPSRMASSHLIWALPLLFLLARSSESVNARCLSDP